MSDKIYVGTGKAINTQYGELIKLSFTADDIEKLQENLDNGWVNLALNKRREPSEKGATHYMTVDTWKPDGARASAPAANNTSDSSAGLSPITPEDIPF